MTDERLEPAVAHARGLVDGRGVPGIALAACEAGRLRLAEGFGYADREARRRVTADTIFALASISKLFTAVGVLRLVESGRLSLEDPVTRWLPELAIPRADAITVHHLLSHTSGLPLLPSRYHALDRSRPGEFTGGAMDVDSARLAGPVTERAAFADCAGLVAYLNGCGVVPLAAPGELHNYSNEGYALLGGVVEAVTGSTYERYMNESVFAPAGLERTAVSPRAAERLGDTATPYHRSRGEVRAIPPWDAPAWAPAGGLRSTALELLRFLATLDVRSPLLAAHARSLATGDGYGYGVCIAPSYGGIRVVWHDGNADGTATAFLWAPERRSAVVALANLDRADALGLARTALNGLLGLPPDTPEFELRELDAGAEVLSEYAGVYASPEGLRYRLELRDGVLGLVLGERFVPCPALGGDRAALLGAPVRFVRRRGAIWALAARHRILPRLDDAAPREAADRAVHA